MAFFGEKGLLARFSRRDQQMIGTDAAAFISQATSEPTKKRQPWTERHIDPTTNRPRWGLGSQEPSPRPIPSWLSHVPGAK